MIRFICIFALAVFFQTVTGQNLVIEGEIENHDDYRMIYFSGALINSQPIDSSKLNRKGAFKIETNIEKPGYYKLELDESNYIFLILTPGKKITIKADMQNLNQPRITGSANSILLYTAIRKVNDYDRKIEDYVKKIEAEKQNYIKNTLLKHPASLASLFLIDQLDIETNYSVYQKVDQALTEKYPDNPFVIELHHKVKNSDYLSIGSKAPDFEISTPKGNTIRLSSLTGKVVLIDFWASWCKPCKKQVQENKALYKQFHNQNDFEILSISLDESKDAWSEAIKKQELNWLHGSDLKGWRCEPALQYAVDKLPYTILIDEKGKIVAKAIFGEELEKAIKELLE